MSSLIIPKGYNAILNKKQTERCIKLLKDFFQSQLATELKLTRVTAPLFVLKGTGINDDLNGVERKVTFPIKDINDAPAEVVNSLAKWKRMALADLNIAVGHGIYTDMNAIRADEELDNLHSLYVDQWDWERVIKAEDRNITFLKEIVKRIYNAITRTEFYISEIFPQLEPILPEKITFISAEDLFKMYPNLDDKGRENEIAKKYGAVFIMGIGGALSNGKRHDGRSPDYDDWSTPNEEGFYGLNGDILLWNDVLGRSVEISSMGIRVDKEALVRQLRLTGNEDRLQLLFHKKLMNDELPLSIGGGIGQSRLCMFMMKKAHIGEVQSSIWPDKQREECEKAGIHLC